jgi:hypothetical protein
MWRSQTKERDRLENGEVVLGRVLKQWGDRNSSSTQCELSDFEWHTHQQIGFDYTKSLYARMTVLVFYDLDNPQRRVAYCLSLHEVVI